MNGFGLILWIVERFLGLVFIWSQLYKWDIAAGLREACRLGHCEDQEQTERKTR